MALIKSNVNGKFYGRSTNGKYELDVTDLRNAFLFANTVMEKVVAFKTERLIALENGQSLIPIVSGPKLVLHCMPLESFGAQPEYNVRALRNQNWIRPMGPGLSGWAYHLNFEGMICIARGFELPVAYTQVYRNGVSLRPSVSEFSEACETQISFLAAPTKKLYSQGSANA